MYKSKKKPFLLYQIDTVLYCKIDTNVPIGLRFLVENLFTDKFNIIIVKPLIAP